MSLVIGKQLTAFFAKKMHWINPPWILLNQPTILVFSYCRRGGRSVSPLIIIQWVVFVKKCCQFFATGQCYFNLCMFIKLSYILVAFVDFARVIRFLSIPPSSLSLPPIKMRCSLANGMIVLMSSNANNIDRLRSTRQCIQHTLRIYIMYGHSLFSYAVDMGYWQCGKNHEEISEHTHSNCWKLHSRMVIAFMIMPQHVLVYFLFFTLSVNIQYDYFADI